MDGFEQSLFSMPVLPWLLWRGGSPITLRSLQYRCVLTFDPRQNQPPAKSRSVFSCTQCAGNLASKLTDHKKLLLE